MNMCFVQYVLRVLLLYPLVDVIDYHNSFYGLGEGAVHIEEISCQGDEPTLLNCSFVNETTLEFHFNDAGVRCFNVTGMQSQAKFPRHVLYMYIQACPIALPLGTVPLLSAEDVCTPGSVRLANSTDGMEGRLEVCLDNVWGTVCQDLFGYDEARVVCGQLGFSSEGVCLC